MQFRISYNKLANFYFFIQNLSEWHFSNRKNYNVLWRKELGKFSVKEEKALNQFKKTRRKYPEGKSCFEQAFFTSEKPWPLLKKALPPREYQSLKKVFESFGNKFHQLYKKDLPRFKEWKKTLNIKMNDTHLTKPIIDILCNLYNVPKPPVSEVLVHLLFSAGGTTGGGANIDSRSISLEISQQPLNEPNVDHAMGIVWHETIHLALDKQYFLPLIQREYPEFYKKGTIIHEITATSLFPRGELAKQFFNRSLGNHSYLGYPPSTTAQLSSLANEYIHQKKCFDKAYIDKMLSLIDSNKAISTKRKTK